MACRRGRDGCRDAGAPICSRVSFTDSAVKSSPLWNLTPAPERPAQRRRRHLLPLRDEAGDRVGALVPPDEPVEHVLEHRPARHARLDPRVEMARDRSTSPPPARAELRAARARAGPPSAPDATPAPTAICKSFRRVIVMLASPAGSPPLIAGRSPAPYSSCRRASSSSRLASVRERAPVSISLTWRSSSSFSGSGDAAPPAFLDDPADHVLDLGRAACAPPCRATGPSAP